MLPNNKTQERVEISKIAIFEREILKELQIFHTFLFICDVTANMLYRLRILCDTDQARYNTFTVYIYSWSKKNKNVSTN